MGNLTLVGGQLRGNRQRQPEEVSHQIANPNNNPLNIACQAGFADTDTEGTRKRAIGTGELVNTGVLGTADANRSRLSSSLSTCPNWPRARSMATS